MSLDIGLSIEVDTGGKSLSTLYLYDANITHNLTAMADEAGIYEALWRPEEVNATKAGHLIAILSRGLKLLKDTPEHYETFNPANGWGTYEQLLATVQSYLEACIEHPLATISISR